MSRAEQLFARQQPIDPLGSDGALLVMETRREQVEDHGHTPETDRALPVDRLAEDARRYLVDALFCLGETQNNTAKLRQAITYLRKGGAIAIAAVDRVISHLENIEKEDAA